MKSKKKIWIGIVSLVLALLLFAALLLIEASMKKEPPYKRVVCVKEKTAPGTRYQEHNIEELLEMKNVPESLLPEGCLLSLEEAANAVTQSSLSKGSILTKAVLKEYEDYYEAYDCLTWVSLPLEQLFEGVAGTLRPGDYLDIYTIREQEEAFHCELLAGRVRVESAYTSQGVKVTTQDTDSLCQLLVIPMEQGKVSLFYEQLAQGKIRIAKYEQ